MAITQGRAITQGMVGRVSHKEWLEGYHTRKGITQGRVSHKESHKGGYPQGITQGRTHNG